jgi:heme exporter protein D
VIEVMETWQAFLTMGGYSGYVWPAYGISIVVMVVLLAVSLRGAKAREAELELLQRSRPGRRRNGKPETQA